VVESISCACIWPVEIHRRKIDFTTVFCAYRLLANKTGVYGLGLLVNEWERGNDGVRVCPVSN
jgi:hypothetical protein